MRKNWRQKKKKEKKVKHINKFTHKTSVLFYYFSNVFSSSSFFSSQYKSPVINWYKLNFNEISYPNQKNCLDMKILYWRTSFAVCYSFFLKKKTYFIISTCMCLYGIIVTTIDILSNSSKTKQLTKNFFVVSIIFFKIY